ncbi:hypothetical protein ACFQXA_21785 [Nocardiopsis composta]
MLLSGHSQGSVLAAATVWQLPPRCRPRVALITHGSPLHRLYARYFPAHFGPAALADVERRVAYWRNLWRCTDAIGGRCTPRRAARGRWASPSRCPIRAATTCSRARPSTRRCWATPSTCWTRPTPRRPSARCGCCYQGP